MARKRRRVSSYSRRLGAHMKKHIRAGMKPTAAMRAAHRDMKRGR